jgi:hypothetical protein
MRRALPPMPRRRRVYGRDAKDRKIPEPLFVAIDLKTIVFC